MTTPDHTRSREWTATACRACAALLVAAFLASVAQFYHPEFGFTGLIGFGPQHHEELPAIQAVPHRHYETGGYDGQFYAQLAVEPLLKDAAIDRALDSPPYRSRRILFSWTAHALGLGRPAWILQAYAVQNVLCWLLLAWLLTRWMPVSTPRGLALWAACLWNQGLLGSVRLSLVDGPSVLLIASAMAAVESGRTWLASATLGLAGIARETNLMAVVGSKTGTLNFLQTLKKLPKKSWLFETVRFCKKVSVPVFLTLAPLLIWQDYLWSIYRHRAFAGQNQLTIPFTAFAEKWVASLQGVSADGFLSAHLLSLVALISLTTQTLVPARAQDVVATVVAGGDRLRRPHARGPSSRLGRFSWRRHARRYCRSRSESTSCSAGTRAEASGSGTCSQTCSSPTRSPNSVSECPPAAIAAAATRALAQAHWKLKPPMRPSTSRISPVR